MNSKRQVTQPRPQGGKSPGDEVASNGEIWSRGKNSRLPIDANVMLNLSFQGYPTTIFEKYLFGRRFEI